MKFKILDILNANVYLTNIISIPIIILIYLIVQDIKEVLDYPRSNFMACLTIKVYCLDNSSKGRAAISPC